MVEGRFPRPFALAALAADSPGRLSICCSVSILSDRELTSPICLQLPTSHLQTTLGSVSPGQGLI